MVFHVGTMIDKTIINKFKISRYFYYVYREIMKREEERRRFWKDAVVQFSEGTAKHGNLKDYKRALYRNRFLY